MSEQKTAKRRGKMIPLREEKLNSIGFVWDEKEYNWKVWFAALKSFKEKEGRWPRRQKAEDKREAILADGEAVLRDLARWMSKPRVHRDKLKEVERDWLFIWQEETGPTGRSEHQQQQQ